MERKLSISAANSNPLAIGCFLQYFIFYLIWLWRLWTPVTDSHFSSTQKWLISVPRKYQGNTSNGDLAELVRSLAVLFLLSGKVLVVSSEVSWWRSGENHAVFTYEEKWWSSSLSESKMPMEFIIESKMANFLLSPCCWKDKVSEICKSTLLRCTWKCLCATLRPGWVTIKKP